MTPILKDFAIRMVELHGETGKTWLHNLPALLEECARRWSLAISPPFEPLSYNYVAPATLPDGTDVVLKVGVPDPELLAETAALQIYNGRGIVRLLDSDPDQGFLLLERLKPGTTLFNLGDDERATSIATGIMRQLWQPAPAGDTFPTVAKWAKGMERLRVHYHGGTGPFPKRLVETAERLFDDLLGSMAAPVLLHGDLHHWNILAAERQPWLALDPKGVIGEPAYEVGTWLRNPLPQLLEEPHPERVLARRVDQFSDELDFDRERIVSWGVAQAVLSGWWMVEDYGSGWEPVLELAEILASML